MCVRVCEREIEERERACEKRGRGSARRWCVSCHHNIGVGKNLAESEEHTHYLRCVATYCFVSVLHIALLTIVRISHVDKLINWFLSVVGTHTVKSTLPLSMHSRHCDIHTVTCLRLFTAGNILFILQFKALKTAILKKCHKGVNKKRQKWHAPLRFWSATTSYWSCWNLASAMTKTGERGFRSVRFFKLFSRDTNDALASELWIQQRQLFLHLMLY